MFYVRCYRRNSFANKYYAVWSIMRCAEIPHLSLQGARHSIGKKNCLALQIIIAPQTVRFNNYAFYDGADNVVLSHQIPWPHR